MGQWKMHGVKLSIYKHLSHEQDSYSGVAAFTNPLEVMLLDEFDPGCQLLTLKYILGVCKKSTFQEIYRTDSKR